MIIRIYRIEEEDILTQSRKDAEEDRLGEDPSPYRVRVISGDGEYFMTLRVYWVLG